MDHLPSDIRYAIRSLIKRPGFTLVAVITLALGIGANSVIFSAINALLLKPLPIPEQQRVVALWDRNISRGVERNEVSMANFLDWKAQSQSFEHLGIYRWWSANLTGLETPERLQGFLVSAGFFDTLGVKPILGRTLVEDENQPGKDAVVVLTHALWQRRFGGDPNIVNKTITLNGIARTVIGVMPPRFNYPKGAEAYAPLSITPELKSNRDFHTYLAIGRLKTEVTLQNAQAELDTITGRLEKQYPESNTGLSANVFPIVADTVRTYDTALWVMMAAVGLVLLIACANVANLMLARASGRQKEIALRAALGASRWRIVRQLLTESLVVALIGGLVGVAIAYWGIDLLRVSNPGEAARYAAGWDQLGLNLPVVGFTLLLSVLSGLIFGLAPSWQISKPNLNHALKDGGRQTGGGSHHLRSGLVVFEVAVSLILLVSAGLLVRSFLSLLKTNPGFNGDSILTMNFVLPASKYKDRPARAAFYADFVQRVKNLSGVESAALVSHIPLGGANASDNFLIEGVPEPPPGQEDEGRVRVCTPDYFKTMGIAVLQGRAFTDYDKVGSTPVVIINETFAKKYWPNGDALGKRIRFVGPLAENPWKEVVGVVQDVRHELNVPVTTDYYLPHAQESWSSMVLVAKTKVDPVSMTGPIKQQLWSIDKDQPVFDIKTMDQVRAISVTVYSFSSVMLGIFAGVALLLASVGIYGVMAFVVNQRTHEIGIRMALGARAGDVRGMIVKNGMKLALLGVGIGLLGSWLATRFIAKLLVGVPPTDLLTFSAVSVFLLFAAFLACYLPARRATKVDPLVALRCE